MLLLWPAAVAALLWPAPLRTPLRTAPHRSCCAVASEDELGVTEADMFAGDDAGGGDGARQTVSRNTTQGRLLGCANRLQVLTPSASIDRIGEALQGHALAPHNLTSLLLMLKRRHRWRQAALLMEYAQATRVPLRTMHYNILMSACARASPRRALALFSKMSAEGSEVVPDVVSYNAAMSAASFAGESPQV